MDHPTQKSTDPDASAPRERESACREVQVRCYECDRLMPWSQRTVTTHPYESGRVVAVCPACRDEIPGLPIIEQWPGKKENAR